MRHQGNKREKRDSEWLINKELASIKNWLFSEQRKQCNEYSV